IVFLDRATIAVDVPPPRFPHAWVDHAATRPDEVLARAAGATLLVTNKVRLAGDVIERLDGLRMIAVAATGIDVVDIDACRRRGVVVTHARGYAARSVAEHVLGVVLALRRRLVENVTLVRDGVWSRAPTFTLHRHAIEDVAGLALGIVGYGAIGRATAELLAAVGARVLIAERRGEPARPGRVAFDEVLASCDALSLHCPLSAATRGLVGRDEIARMRRGALLVNTARGALVDVSALVDALRARHLGGAALDVLDVEPPPEDHPALVAPPPNLLVTPHVAWASRSAQTELARQLVENLEAFVAGRPVRAVP
ncbi:MAG TPA: NAD(P)-dependent oxidoreductase, partial [Minicystis sp.]|nr:NAD(P)-dependent oxidoreductase [Minicystis sp.]